MTNKKALLVILIIGLTIGVLKLTRLIITPDKNHSLIERCLLYVKYDTDVRAWYWQVPANNDYFETKEDAIDNCEDYWRLN